MPLSSFTIDEILKSRGSIPVGPPDAGDVLNLSSVASEKCCLRGGICSCVGCRIPAELDNDKRSRPLWTYLNREFQRPSKLHRGICAPHQNNQDINPAFDSEVSDTSFETKSLNGVKRRRLRTVFTDSQLVILEDRFHKQKYLPTPDRTKVAKVLGLTQLQVKTWYQNRRMRWKKALLSTGKSEEIFNSLRKSKGRPKKNFDYEPTEQTSNAEPLE